MVDYTTSNPFFGNPYIERTSQNLIKAFKVDSRDEVNREQAGLLREKRAQAVRENQGNIDAQHAIKDIDPTMPITADFIKGFAANSIAAGLPAKEAADMTLYLTSNLGRPVGEISRAFVGTGKAIGKDQGFSIEDREGVAARENSAALNRTATSAGIAAGASRANNADRLQFERDNPTEERVKGGALRDHITNNPDSVTSLFFKPVELSPGQTAYPAPGDPRMPDGPTTNKKALPPHNIPAGGAAIIPSDSPYSGAPQVPGPPSSGNVVKVTPDTIADLEFNVLSSIPGAMSSDGRSIDPRFSQEYGDKMQTARLEAAKTFQETSDAAQAQRAYLEALGVAPGSEVEKPGGISRLFGAPSVRVNPPAGAPAAALPAEAAASLKEGVMTTFGNGQTWTLNGSTPQRVK